MRRWIASAAAARARRGPVRLGDAEDGHHRVAGDLLDRPPARPIRRHRVVEALELDARPLRVLLLAERRRADEVGEDDGGQLPLGGLHAAILTCLGCFHLVDVRDAVRGR